MRQQRVRLTLLAPGDPCAAGDLHEHRRPGVGREIGAGPDVEQIVGAVLAVGHVGRAEIPRPLAPRRERNLRAAQRQVDGRHERGDDAQPVLRAELVDECGVEHCAGALRLTVQVPQCEPRRRRQRQAGPPERARQCAVACKRERRELLRGDRLQGQLAGEEARRHRRQGGHRNVRSDRPVGVDRVERAGCARHEQFCSRTHREHPTAIETTAEPYRKGSHVKSTRGRLGVESTQKHRDDSGAVP